MISDKFGLFLFFRVFKSLFAVTDTAFHNPRVPLLNSLILLFSPSVSMSPFNYALFVPVLRHPINRLVGRPFRVMFPVVDLRSTVNGFTIPTIPKPACRPIIIPVRNNFRPKRNTEFGKRYRRHCGLCRL